MFNFIKKLKMKMIWTIILINENEWYINYIKNKLLIQINNLKLQNNIEIVVLNNILEFQNSISIFGYYINIIKNEDISDNYIEIIYNKIKNKKIDLLKLRGVVYIDNKSFKFNQINENENENFLFISKINPIKKDIIINNLDDYLVDNIKNLDSDDIKEFIIFLERKNPISIIITAYKSQDFIEECLDSIENQTYFKDNNDFEVLVGVDNCYDTLNKLNQIKDKYRNFHIYMMDENKGTYITTNTLINLVKNENVIRFDSDDIMCPDLVEKVLNNKQDYDIIKLGYVDMTNGVIDDNIIVESGIIYFKKSVMDYIAGGWKPWICAADTELIKRLENKVKISEIKDKLFIRRIHENSLTNKKDTGYNSDLRKEYTNQIKNNYNEDEIKIDRIVNQIRFYSEDENSKIEKIVNNMKIAVEIPHYDPTSGGIQRMIRLVMELPHYNPTSGGVNESIKLGNKFNPDVVIRFQKLLNFYPQIDNTWSVGLPDNTFPDCDVCITYSDNPYLEDLVNLPQVKKVFLLMLSYGMSIERERKNVLNDKVIVMCSTKKIEKMILAEDVKVHRIGFSVEQDKMYNEKKKRKNYLVIMYHPSKDKKYSTAVEISDYLFSEKLIDGVITFGTELRYNEFIHPKGLVKHYSNANRDEIHDVFNICKCFLMPSISEGLNLTPIESTLCGCPAILCDGAIDEIFFNNKNCFVVSSNDKTMMIEKSKNVILNFDKYSDCFSHNMREVLKDFTWEKVIENLNKLLW